MKIAVIGGGLAGLAAAWLLSKRHTVTLLERHAQPGFIASSVALPGGERVDVPLRVFYRGYYPTLTRLYDALGVATEPVSYATTFSGADGRAFFRWRNLRLGGLSYPYLLPHDLLSRRARRIAWAALAFGRLARQAAARGELAGQTITEFTARHGLAAEFVEGLLLPTVATIATCTTDDARAYPADVVADYLAAGVSRESVRRAKLGADDVAARLVAGIGNLQCNAGVQAVQAGPAGRSVHVQRLGGADARYDHVVLATQANQALALWASARPDEAATLAGFRYRALEVVMHRDETLMPARRSDWSAVNARVGAGLDRPESTIWVNAVQPALRRAGPVFQTVQPQREPRTDRVIARARFERPLVDAGSQQALAALQRLHAEPGRRVWLCGSYAQAGVPLLESAVCSAYAVAAAIDGAAKATGRTAVSRA
jgi:predicted NAD/FAD-binding protein